MIHAVVMAGGKGTRFWPLSRESRPKQVLPVVGGKTMIQETVERLSGLVPPERTYVVTGASHADEIRAQLPEIPPRNVIVEPAGRNTAPCIALSAAIIKKIDPDGVMAVFPSDHVISKQDALYKAMDAVMEGIDKDRSALGVIGIKPHYPETGYGYIKTSATLGGPAVKAEEFLEKPDLATAERYVQSGNYYWNAGMFFWRADVILDEIGKSQPGTTTAVLKLAEAFGTARFDSLMAQTYPSLASISIDYAVMERAGAEGRVIAAVADPGWSDVGSWRSLYDLVEPDSEGNRARGKLIAVDSTGAFAHNDKRLVAVVGLNDVIVIETDDAILVCHKDRAQDVRQVTEKLKERGLTGYL
ncbi:MAG: mannose-1-phosphate guanylyltransferase [Nitrospinae bacterium]|nr:mannose-1-phosphate guanylyltransferase [Nitrospinota bacterium]MBF0635150.1 mannose-1-phosphate guanylyltransferase [Nitrospinota bacterium]